MQFIISLLVPFLLMASCGTSQKNTASEQKEAYQQKDLSQYSVAYIASGCFWCVEAIYESVEGVEEAVSGYAGGSKANPTYREVGMGGTGHAEVLAVYYDPEVVSFKTLIDVYYASQDPTTIGQKPDFGPAYRSIIFYATDEEKDIAEAAKKEQAKMYDKPIVTEIVPFEKFWPAEDYHQDYEKKNPNQPYVVGVSIPRLKRFQKKMPEVLKEEH